MVRKQICRTEINAFQGKEVGVSVVVHYNQEVHAYLPYRVSGRAQ